eukprot:Sdes_comp10414_c0_seq1m2080
MSSNEEESLTLVEYLAREEELEKAAFQEEFLEPAEKCSYQFGYIQQPIFCCLTCVETKKSEQNFKDEEIFSGICFSCSVFCHENHKLIEIYSKRNFRCDCGNSKMTDSFSCSLLSKKDPFNT